MGSATAFFLKAIDQTTQTTHQLSWYYIGLPLVMMVNIMIKRLCPDSEGHGTEKVIEAIHKRFGNINARIVPIKAITTIMTIATGGSVGKEGPSAQIGGALASLFSKIIRLNKHDRKKLVICGISAGFAAVFGTPIAGAIFAVEVLFAGSLLYDVLLPSFVASMIGYQVASTFGLQYDQIAIHLDSTFHLIFFAKVVLGGIFFGLLSFAFIEVLKKGKRLSDKLKVWEPLKGLIGGTLIIGLALIFSTQYLGLGQETMHSVFRGGQVIWYACLVKMLITTITLSFGGSGGVITPIFFIGATAGVAFSHLIGEPSIVFAALGLVGVLAGCANTPLAGSIMAVELFGPSIAPYATIVCVISYLMTGYRSVFHSQILATNKAPSISMETGHDMDYSDTHFIYATRKRIVKSIRFGKAIIRKKRPLTTEQKDQQKNTHTQKKP